MGHWAQRFTIRIGRSTALFILIAAALLLIAYWVGPLKAPPARIELVVVEDGVATDRITGQPRQSADGALVFAIPLAVRNTGSANARPRRMALSVPANFRVMLPGGRLSGVVTPGLPLRRYVIELPNPEMPADSNLKRLPGLDTIYLEPDLPRYYCAIHGLGIPEFSPAPQFDAQALADVRIYYSFTDARGNERHTGLLSVALDPERLRVTPAPMPPAFTTIVELPQARAPNVGVLSYAGTRRAFCGDPQQPVEIYTVLWETPYGGRVYTLYVDNIGRKRLYDLNRDGIIEFETWDTDADGLFEASRQARYEVPAFLVPLPPRDSSMVRPDPLDPDTLWLELFNDRAAGPHRFGRKRYTPHPLLTARNATIPDSAAAARLRNEIAQAAPVDSQVLVLFANTHAGPFRFARHNEYVVRSNEANERVRGELADVTPADSAFLDLFANTAAGPFRFSPNNAQAAAAPPAVAGAGDSTAATAAASAAASAAAARDARMRAELANVTPADPAFLELFANTAAGPFRFSRGVPEPEPTPAQAGTAEPAEERSPPPERPEPQRPPPTQTEPVRPPPQTTSPAPERRREPLGDPVSGN